MVTETLPQILCFSCVHLMRKKGKKRDEIKIIKIFLFCLGLFLCILLFYRWCFFLSPIQCVCAVLIYPSPHLGATLSFEWPTIKHLWDVEVKYLDPESGCHFLKILGKDVGVLLFFCFCFLFCFFFTSWIIYCNDCMQLILHYCHLLFILFVFIVYT